MHNGIPDEFITNIFIERKQLLISLLQGKLTKEEIFLGFTRHTPVIATYGPSGINASVKGIGFIPKKEFIYEMNKRLQEFIKNKTHDLKTRINFLIEYIYDENKIDFNYLAGIEMAKKHTWINIKNNPVATLLFYIPPDISYEVRCTVTIHLNDVYWEYVNGIHDLFHTSRRNWKEYPVYLFKIREIYDNSPKFMGKKIFNQETTTTISQ